jgi:coenzyme F420-reducing hydrogenase alpha subunit
MNTAAQVIEIVHCVEGMIQIIGRLLEGTVGHEIPVAPTRESGEGVGACEVPRGTLYHHYTMRNGLVTDANCVIPTSQNLANIELDMRELISRMLDRPQEEITHALEMLVRAYDPCISCATHLLEVNYV